MKLTNSRTFASLASVGALSVRKVWMVCEESGVSPGTTWEMTMIRSPAMKQFRETLGKRIHSPNSNAPVDHSCSCRFLRLCRPSCSTGLLDISPRRWCGPWK
ncbi:hypothetical protein D3C84_953040 [compost metagenome]